MTSPILRGLSRRKHCQNLDTKATALRVGKQAPQKTLQNHRYADLWAKRPKEMVSGRHIKDNKNGKQVNFSFSKIWWASKVSLLAIRNDCVARSYRFSVPLTCTRAIIRQKVYYHSSLKELKKVQEQKLKVLRVRSALRLMFCEVRFCWSRFFKKLNSTVRGAFFRRVLRLHGDNHCTCAQKWCHFSYFSKTFQTKKK